MSSSTLLSLCRLAFLPSQSPLFPSLRIGIRSFSNVTSPRQLPMTSEFPKVANSSELDGSRSRQEAWHQISSRARTDMSSHPMLNPYSGRTVPVRREVGESLRALDGILSRNKVKLQLRMTERHEKKGYKRRRLASERWRNQFANEVRKKVQLVMKMRDRGA